LGQFNISPFCSDLPLETWVDLFYFLSRLQLMQLVTVKKCGIYLKINIFFQIPPRRRRRGKRCRLTIEDRQFVSFVQFFLHKCGEITFGRLHIRSSRNRNEQIVIVNEEDRELPLAVVPISENVKNFESIRLRFVFTLNFV
jgi:hypothetical protein